MDHLRGESHQVKSIKHFLILRYNVSYFINTIKFGDIYFLSFIYQILSFQCDVFIKKLCFLATVKRKFVADFENLAECFVHVVRFDLCFSGGPKILVENLISGIRLSWLTSCLPDKYEYFDCPLNHTSVTPFFTHPIYHRLTSYHSSID
jgi:hypothetical protein